VISEQHVHLVLVSVGVLFCRSMYGVMAPALHEHHPVSLFILDRTKV
jgi:hypothetical protein